jgi:hypothetical protein
MAKKNVTLSLDEEIYEKYKIYCAENAVALSRSIEIFMQEKVASSKKVDRRESHETNGH